MIGKINDYSQLGLLGQGSYGSVWEVQSVNRQKYAIKLIAVTNDTKADTLKQAEIYIKLSHPNILKARQFFFYSQERFLAIVLQFCPDGDLSQKIGALQIDQCQAIMKQVTEGLIYLHNDKKIIHRDLKPQNILLQDGFPKIADMGFAKLINTTGTSSKIGAQNYMAPEVFNQRKYTDQSDIWSLGMIFLELLAGIRIHNMTQNMIPPALQPNFPSENILNRIRQKEYIPMISKMLSKDPSGRMTSKQVLQTLNDIKIQKKFKNKPIDKRSKLQEMSKKDLIQVISKDIYFPNLLHIIQLTQNQIADSGLIKLVQNAHKFPYLQELYLPRNKITSKGLQFMATNGDKFPNLQQLGLGQNQINDSGMIALAQNGDKFVSLQTIILSQNQITDVGLKQFAVNGEKFLNLKQLYLPYNKISDQGLRQFFEKGRNFPHLQKVDFEHNQISEQGLKIVARYKQNFLNLQAVYLGNDKISKKAY